MASTNPNGRAGILSQKLIEKDSLYLNKYFIKAKTGRKSLISCEFLDMSKDNLIGLTLVDKSLFILLPTYYPEIYTDVPDGEVLKKAFKGYWNYICQTARAVDGIPDLALDIQKPTFKSVFFSLPLCTRLQNPIDEITLTVPAELASYFITNQTRHWMNAISDEYTNIATYNSLEESYNNWSHSAGMAYLKPDKSFRKLDYAALWFLMIPKQAQTSNYNADATAPGVIEMQMPFHVSVIDYRNIRVRDLCESLLAKYRNFIVDDSSLFGLVKDTALDTVEELQSRDIFSNLITQ